MTAVLQLTVLQTAAQNKKNLNSLNGASKDRKNTVMPNSTAISLLIQHYQKEKVTFDRYDIESLEAMLQLRQKSYIDDKGQVTDLGIARSLMGLFNLRLLDVLALAYVASKPVNASRSRFEDLAWGFSITKRSVCEAFRRLSSMKLVDHCGLGVFIVSDKGARSLKAHMPKLSRIDRNRDELFKKRTLNI